MQIPLDLELDPAGGPGLNCVTHVITHRPVNERRQIAVHPRPVGTTQGGLQIQHAWKPRATTGNGGITGFPFDLRLTLCIDVAELDVGQLDSNALTIDLPPGIR